MMTAPLYQYKEHGKGSWEQELGGHLNLENSLLLFFFPVLLSVAWSGSLGMELQQGGKEREQITEPKASVCCLSFCSLHLVNLKGILSKIPGQMIQHVVVQYSKGKMLVSRSQSEFLKKMLWQVNLTLFFFGRVLRPLITRYKCLNFMHLFNMAHLDIIVDKSDMITQSC